MNYKRQNFKYLNRLTSAAFFLFLSFFFFLSCTEENVMEETEEIFFQTWESLNQKPVKTRYIPAEKNLPKGAFPWGGTVSHHLLAAELIDQWFKELAEKRNVDLFYILSPSHWNLSTEKWSLTDGAWKTKDGYVFSDKEETVNLKKIFAVPFEPRVFKYEHGVSVLMPYIKKYFPDAKAAVIAYWGNTPANMEKASFLASALEKIFPLDERSYCPAKKKNSKSKFLLISADFSHKLNAEHTHGKDLKTRRFFESLNPELWYLVTCDNNPAMYALSKLITPKTVCTIQRHSDAYALHPDTNPEDITSYFFTYFWEDNPSCNGMR